MQSGERPFEGFQFSSSRERRVGICQSRSCIISVFPMEEVMEIRLIGSSSQHLASTVRALTAANHASLAFFDAIAEAAKSDLQDFHARNPASMVWVLAAAGLASPGFLMPSQEWQEVN